MAKLLPPSNFSIAKYQKSAIVKADKFLGAKTKTTNVNVKESTKESPKLLEDTLTKIERKVIQIDKLLKDSLFLSKKENEKKRKGEEQKEFEGREKELEKKKPKEVKGVKLPTPPKMGFLDWIRNFITQTVLGFIAVRLIDYLPNLLSLLPTIITVTDFITDVGGKMLDGLITFIDWGYKAYDATRGFIKNIGGEGLAQTLDKFGGALNGLLDAAIVIGLASLAMGRDEGAPGGGRRGFDTQGRRVGKDVQKRYAQRYGREQFLDRFGKKNLRNLSGGMQRNAFQKGARSAFMGLAGKQGAKTVLKFVKPLVNKIPIIGGLIEFGLSWALGEPVGKAAFRGIGSVLVGAIGTAIGGPVGAFLGSWAGGEAGGILYDMFFGNKKVKPQGKVAKAAGGGRPATRGGKLVSGSARRTVTKKKKPRTLKATPSKLKPGSSIGGEKNIKKLYPESKDKTKMSPFDFLKKSYETFSKATGIGSLIAIAIKPLMGDKPSYADYKNAGVGINNWMNQSVSPGTLAYAGGGEVTMESIVTGEDYSNVIAKSLQDSVAPEVDKTIQDLMKQLMLKPPTGGEKMLQQNNQRGVDGENGAMQDATLSQSEMDLFQRLVYAESGGEGKTGMALVARSVLNRAGLIQSGKATTGTFSAKDKTVTGVIMGRGQYTPVSNGRINEQRSQKQMDDAKEAIKLAQDPERLKSLLKSEGIDDGSIKKLLASTGFRNYNAGAGYDASQAVNEVRYKRHTFNTAGNTGLIIASSQISEKIKPVPLSGGDGRFIQGNSGRSEGTHFHIGTNKPGDGSGVATAGFNVIKNFLGKKSVYVGRSKETIPAGATDEQIRGYIARGQAAHRQTELDLQIGGIGAGNKVAFPLALKGMKYSSTDGYGVSADIVGTNAFVGHGRYKPDGSLAPQQKLVLNMGAPDYYAFHGKVGIVPKDGFMLKLHKGEMYKVIDKDSVDLLGFDLTKEIIDIENRAQLVARAPSIIEKLKTITISGYPDYGQPYGGEPQIIEVPVEIPVPVPMGGRSSTIVAGGGVNNSNDMFDQTLAQIG